MSIDHFLVLSNNRKSVLYKLSDFTFVPFQEIDSADQIASVVKDTTMILFLAKNDSLNVYQYDGWRFVKVNYELNGIEIIKSIIWKNEEHLIVKDVEGKWSLMRYVIGLFLSIFYLLKRNKYVYIIFRLKWSKAKARGEYIDDIKQWCSAAKDQARIIPNFMNVEKPIEVSNINLNKITANSVSRFLSEIFIIFIDTPIYSFCFLFFLGEWHKRKKITRIDRRLQKVTRSFRNSQ